MNNPPPATTMTLTPRQAFEVARLLDRTGDGIVYGDAEIVTLLVDVYGTGSPNLALKLDRDADVIASQALTLHRPDEDELDDLGEEEPLPYPGDLSHARPARRCECPHPRHDGDETCSICGHLLAVEAGTRGRLAPHCPSTPLRAPFERKRGAV
jgi:hypothetical protein